MVVEVARDSERRFNAPIETSVPLVGETRGDSLHIAELLLRDQKLPDIPAEPATEQQDSTGQIFHVARH